MRLQSRADMIGRRSARQLGIVLSVATIAELRAMLGRSPLPDHIRPIGPVSPFVTAYAVSFGGRVVAILHDQRGAGMVCAFVEMDDPILPSGQAATPSYDSAEQRSPPASEKSEGPDQELHGHEPHQPAEDQADHYRDEDNPDHARGAA